jgi:hypothetical protein
MSLKWFHLFFISLAIVVSVAFGLWGLANDYALLGALSLVAAAALGWYGGYFFQKARKLGLAALMVAAAADPAFACPVCFGASDAPAVQGMQMAILALLALTVAVLGAFAAFFLYLRQRARMVSESETPVVVSQSAHEGSY